MRKPDAAIFAPLLDSGTNGVSVYCASYAALAIWESDPRSVLSADEMVRAGRFVFEKDRNQFTLAHAYLRRVLELGTGLPAATIPLSTEEGEAPKLAPLAHRPPLHLSLSHCASHVAVAISPLCPVGVDVEHISSAQGGAEIAANFFSSSEQRDLVQVTSSSYDHRFLRLWTAKEALSKALGLGLNLPFDSFSVIDNGISATIEFGSSDGAFVSETLFIDVGPDCVCAVVSVDQISADKVRTSIDELRCAELRASPGAAVSGSSLHPPADWIGL